MDNAMKKRTAGWLAAGLGLWLAAGTAWAQHLAPVNPAFAKWMKDGGKEAAAARRAAARARGDEGPSLGYVPEVADLSYLADLNDSLECGVSAGRPSRYDLRDEGRVTPVRDQGTHPTCWAHAAMASLEPSAAALPGVAAPDFSELHMAANHGWSASTEDGGNALMASGYLLRWAGPVAEADGESPSASPEAHVQRTRWVPAKVAALDNDRIKDAIVAHGPLYASLWWSQGYYDADKASFRAPAEAQGRSPNHAVALVGWDDAYPRGNFRDPPPGDGAWLAKNSWGEDWGDGGFFWVSYWDATLGWSTMYAFTGAEPADNYDAVWEHDPLGFVNYVGGAGSTAWGANAFTAAAAAKIAAVGFWALAPRTSYHLWVYAGGTAGKPRSGRLISDQSGSVDDAGYVTVPLETPAEVAAGERFTVVAKLTTPSHKYPLAVEYRVHGATDAANAAKGQSYLSLDGQTWSDFTEKVHATANFCLKAYAKSGETARTLAGLAISGPATIASGKSAAYACEARYSDGSARPVDPAWSIAEGAIWAAVDAAGTVTAGEVDETVRATLRADYEESGTSASAEWTFEVTVAAPAAPAGLVATEGTETSCVRLSWDASAGAATYAVWRSPTSESRNAAYLGASSVPRYSDTTALPGADFTYFVKARNGTGTSPFSDGAAGWRALSAPAGVEAADGTDLDAVAVSWEASEGAAAYRVWRAPADAGDDGDSDAWTDLSGWIVDRTFLDTTAEPGVPYRYAVSAAVTPSGWRESAPSLWDEGRRAVPVALSALEIDGPVALESGATGDYRCTALYTDGSRIPDVPATWTADAGTLESAGDGSLARWTAPVVAANASVLLRAAWTDTAGTAAEAAREVAVTPVRPAAPDSIQTLSATVDGVTLGWTPSPGASGYVLWRGTDAADRGELAETADTAHSDTGGEPGTTYRYWVAAANAAGASEPSAAFAEATRLVAAPARVTATHGARAAAVTVSWVPGPGATHHRVWRADAPEAAKTALGDWVPATTWTDATAEPGAEYFYWVESAADANGNASGGLSAPVAGMRLAPREAVEVLVDGPGEVSAGTSAAYAATVAFNDGTSEAAAVVWSVFGGADWAAIDADGVLTVSATAADATVAVVASWTPPEGSSAPLEGRRMVAIRGAAEASAEITSAVLHARWPWNGWVDVDYTLATAPEGQTATVSLSGWDLDHHEALAARTLEGDGADGEPVSAGPHRLSWNLGTDHPGFHAKDFRVSMGATPWIPDAPGSDKQPQRVDFAPIGPQTLDSRVALRATATSGGAVTFSVVSGPGELEGNVLTFTGTGRVIVSATQAGDAEWEAATATQSVLVLADSADNVWLVVDMAGGPDALSWPVEWLDEEPEGGFNTALYKTDKLVLRRIAPGTFTMGSPADELGRWDTEDQHEVTLTKPFFLGLFEVTQRQWELALGTRPSYFSNDSCYAMRPVEPVSYEDIRGRTAGERWPADNSVDDGSFLAVIREKTGLAFDLPTEAQCEWACRAGTTTMLNSGKDLTGTDVCPNLDEVGRYWGNGGQNGTPSSGTSAGTAEVGSFLPNAWGLYDMHGNVCEWCLDWYTPHLTGSDIDPVGPASGSTRVLHGGGWVHSARFCRSATRHYRDPAELFKGYGFRLGCTASGKRTQRVVFAPVGPQTVGGRVELSATATSGGPVAFSLVSGPGALDGNVLTFTGEGTVVVLATQGGDDAWEEASATLSVIVTATAEHRYAIVSCTGGWHAAKADAEARGGHLATITSAEEWAVITNQFGAQLLGCWIGGTDAEVDGEWQWVTGEPWTFTWWGSGEPNGGTHQNYLWIHTGSVGTYRWDDSHTPYYEATKYLLEIEGSTPAGKETATVTLGGLSHVYDGTGKAATVTTEPEGLAVRVTYDGGEALPVEVGEYAVEATVVDALWEGSATGVLVIEAAPEPEHRYEIVEWTGGWISAKANAEARGGHLATITSAEEWAVITNQFGRQLLGCWLGGTDAVAEGDWRWVTGEPWTFTWWGSGEPNGRTRQNYLWIHIDSVGTYRWDDNQTPCSQATKYLLEIDGLEPAGKEPATVTLGGLSHVYDGSGKAATVTTVPAGLTVEVLYNGSEALPVEVGEYAVEATVVDALWQGRASGVLTISAPPVTNHRYEIVSWTNGWISAKADAEMRGGHLATVTSAGEWAVITNQFGQQLLGCWLGGTDAEVEGDWRWVTGEPWTFTWWGSGEPNGRSKQNYLWIHIGSTAAFNWDDNQTPCEEATKYLLEIEESEPEEPVVSEHRYEFVSWTNGWIEAKADAEARGGHLATVTSAEEWTTITNQFGSQLLGCWLGASDAETEGDWQWVTGEPWSFSWWGPGEPNSGTTQNYLWVHHRSYEKFQWDDRESTSTEILGYILEIEGKDPEESL